METDFINCIEMTFQRYVSFYCTPRKWKGEMFFMQRECEIEKGMAFFPRHFSHTTLLV